MIPSRFAAVRTGQPLPRQQIPHLPGADFRQAIVARSLTCYGREQGCRARPFRLLPCYTTRRGFPSSLGVRSS